MSKYQNPISKPEMVTLPRWEYARLVAAKTKMDMVEAIVNNIDSYAVKSVLETIFKAERTEYEEACVRT